jgi:Leucine-rich repeat (LRR) protein
LSPLFDPSTIKNPSELSPSEQKEMILVPEVDTSHLSFWSVYFLSWVDRERCQASFWLVEESREKAEPVPVLDLSGQELSSLPPNVCGTPPPTADGELPSGTADSASPRVPSTTEEGSSVDDSSDDIPKPQQLVETSQKPLPGKLVLAQNKFRAFPLQILTLKHLQSLDLAGNAIQYLSGDMCKLLASLKQLTVLNLSNNQLTTVHENIGLLDGLYSLTLGGQGSKSRKLPDTLFSMEKLRSLDLHGFVIETLPESITKMVSLEFLSLVNNSLVDVASMANGSFPKLRAILLKENRIRTLPWAGLEVPQLHLLDISSNQLSGRLSDTLCHLDSTIELIVSDNQIESVPPAIVQLTSLRSLDLSRNNINQLPPNTGFMTRLEQVSHHPLISH